MNNLFAQNLDSLIRRFDINVKSLMRPGDSVTYDYVLRVRRGANCPTTLKAQIIVDVIKRHHSAKSVEMWMFFVEDYFKNNSPIPKVSTIEHTLLNLLSDAAHLGILPSTAEQRKSVVQLAVVIEKRSA